MNFKGDGAGGSALKDLSELGLSQLPAVFDTDSAASSNLRTLVKSCFSAHLCFDLRLSLIYFTSGGHTGEL